MSYQNEFRVVSRRSFIGTSTVAALSAAALCNGNRLQSAVPAAVRTWISCRDTHLKQTGQLNCWSAMDYLGVDGVEVNVNEGLECVSLHRDGEKYSLATDKGQNQIRDDFKKNGKVITAFCMNNRFEDRLDIEVEWAQRLVKAAVHLGVKAIRIDIYPRKLKAEDILPFSINVCKQLCKVSEGTSVRWGIENHGHVTNNPEFLQKLFDAVGSNQLGLTMDFMNFYWYGHPLKNLDGLFRQFAGRVFHTHCKNLKYPEERRNAQRPVGWEYEKYAAPLYEGDINYKSVAAILRRANYAGDFCLENECLGHYPKEEQPQVLKKEIAFLRGLI